MFSTLDAKSFDELNSFKVRANHHGVDRGKTPPLRTKSIILGPKIRSKTGCMTCRKRKKKCDEKHPTCGPCRNRGEECIWNMKKFDPHKKTSGKQREVLVNVGSESNIEEMGNKGSIDENTENHMSLTRRSSDNLPSSSKPTIIQAHSNLLDVSDPLLIREDTDIIVPDTDTFSSDRAFFENINSFTFPDLLISPSSPLTLHLDDIGLQYLNYFEKKVAKLLCIGSDRSNYFLKTFLAVANSQEAIAHSLAAWGGVFFEGAVSDSVRLHLTQASIEMQAKIFSKTNLDKYDYYVAFCYYLIVIGVERCAGDVNNWYELFQDCTRLLRQYGGLAKFCEDFLYSNDVKWLISNFQHHDIMSSVTLSNGTSCSMRNYNNLFTNNRLLDFGEYGVDPSQGCIQPVYLILGEVMNAKVELKEKRKRLEERLAKLADRATDEALVQHISRDRLTFYQQVDKTYHDLLQKLQNVYPSEAQLSQLRDNETELNDHLKLFDLYKLICKMYLLLYVKRTQPSSGEVQALLLECLIIMEKLLDTKLVASLSMLLLICGVSCCNEFDRIRVRDKFRVVHKRYNTGNVKRVWDIVEEAWKRNEDGSSCIDWVEICEDFGWKLSVC